MFPRALVMRRLAGLLMLLLTALPSAAILAAPAPGTCPMCAAHCCCRPPGARGGGCRISAPCSAQKTALSPVTTVARVILTRPMVLERPATAVTCEIAPAAARPLRMAPVPPDPPPRPVAA